MNVLFIINTTKDPCTAVYMIYFELASFLEEQGHKATILAPQDFPYLSRRDARWVPILYPFFVAWWLIRHGEGYHLIIFHSYAGWVVNLFRTLIPAYRSIQTITTSHGLEPLYYNALKEVMEKTGKPLRFRFRIFHGVLVPWLIRLSCLRSDRITCLTSKEAAYLERNNWGDKTRISVVPHGVQNEFFITREYGCKPSRLLFVGQWLEMKGINYLVEALNILAHEIPELELLCVGTLLEKERVLHSFPKDIRNRIIVHPRLSRKEIVKVYRDTDIFIFPSLYDGFGKVLLEAMAAALPIVSTPVGAAQDILESEVNSLIVPKYNAMEIAKSTRRLLDDPILRERLGRKAQAVATEYKLERIHKMTISLYGDMLASPPPEN